MRLIDKMPKLMLEPVCAPVMRGKQVPSIFVHQEAVDLSLVMQVDEELVEDSIDLARRIDLGNVQLVGSEPGFNLFEHVGRVSKIAASPRRQEIRYHDAIGQARRIGARDVGDNR